MNIQTRYVKSFSNGQITIPKEFREAFGIGDDFWLKLSVDKGKLIAEPIKEEKKMSKAEWRKWLLTVPPLDIDLKVIEENRKLVERKIKDRAL